MRKMVLFAFNGDPVCFVHVLLNALDMNAKGYEGKIVIEGAATKLIPELIEKGNPLNTLWERAVAAGLIEGACRACSNKMGTLEAAKQQGLELLDEMAGHPSMARYRNEGFEVLSF